MFYIFIKKKSSTKIKKYTLTYNIYSLVASVILINMIMATEISTLYKGSILLVGYIVYVVGSFYTEKLD